MKKRVLQFINSFHQGGSERQAVQLTRLLVEDETYEVFLVCLNDEGVLRNEVEKLGFNEIPEFRLTSFFNLDFLKQVKRCAEFIKENKIDIVHTHDFYTNVFGMSAAVLAGVKRKIASKRETDGMRSKAQKIVEKIAFQRADSIVVNAEAIKDYLIRRGVSAGKLNIIYNGLDLERLTPKESSRTTILKEFGLPQGEDVRFITLVANLRHEIKNQPMFLKAAKKILSKYPNTHFILAGEGELQNELENLARSFQIDDNTHFIGLCKKVPELLSISFACALTSFSEGFSNSILEYMSASKPVVATKVGGAAEAIVDNETGFLVESDDDDNLAEKIIWLLDNPDKAVEMGKLGRNIIEMRFSCEAQLNKTKTLYESI